MSIRENLERMEEISLSPFATLSVNSRGRDREEPQCDIRPVFQRDRDRILHCKSFQTPKTQDTGILKPEGRPLQNASDPYVRSVAECPHHSESTASE